jgi:TatD DNase family protein
MILTDTHTHLYSQEFDEDRKENIQKAIDEGVSRFFVPAIDSTYTQKMLDLEALFPNHIFLMTGLHPTHVKENYPEELAHIKSLLSQRKYFAIGEIGIDLYWDKTHLREQQDAFITQLRWAKEWKLPVAIHSRDSFDEIFEILETEKSSDLRGVLHCFTGTLEQANKSIDYNMMLGIGGVVTFKNGKIDQFLNKIPIEYILLETDAPYLAPTPHRGKRNESSYLQLIALKLAEIYQTDLKNIAKITTENSIRLFGV